MTLVFAKGLAHFANFTKFQYDCVHYGCILLFERCHDRPSKAEFYQLLPCKRYPPVMVELRLYAYW